MASLVYLYLYPLISGEEEKNLSSTNLLLSELEKIIPEPFFIVSDFLWDMPHDVLQLLQIQ